MGGLGFTDWMFNKFLEWEKSQPSKRSSYTAFARWLSKNSYEVSISQGVISSWINGTYKPGEKYAPVLAEKLGTEVYDFLDIDPPDPIYDYVLKNWDRLDPEKQREIKDRIEAYLTNMGDKHEASQNRTSESTA